MTRTYGHKNSRSVSSWYSPHARNMKSIDRYYQHKVRQTNKELLNNNDDIDEIDQTLFSNAKGTNRGSNYYLWGKK